MARFTGWKLGRPSRSATTERSGSSTSLNFQETNSHVRISRFSCLIHTCSYHCTRPACVLRQRDELREKLRDMIDAVTEADTPVTDWPATRATLRHA